MSSPVSNDLEQLKRTIDDAVRNVGPSPATDKTTEQLMRALEAEPDKEELRTLNYRWQTYLNREYIRNHHLDQFLDSLTQELLKRKPRHPLEELLTVLKNVSSDSGPAWSTSRKADTASMQSFLDAASAAVPSEAVLGTQVAEALASVLSADNVTRRAAETQLDDLRRAPGFVDALLAYVSRDAATPLPPVSRLRMAAIAVLKQLVVEEQSAELRAYVAQCLLDILAGESDALHDAAALLRQCAATLCTAVVSLARSAGDALHNTGTSVPHSWISFVQLFSERVLDVLRGSSVVAQHAYALMLHELCDMLPQKSYLRAKLLDALPPLFQLVVANVDPTCSATTITSTTTTTITTQLQLQHVAIGVIHQMYLWALSTRGRHSNTAKVLGGLLRTHFAPLCLYWLEPCAAPVLHTESDMLPAAELRRWRLAQAVGSLSCTVELLAVTRWRVHLVDAPLLQAVLHALQSDVAALQHTLMHVDDGEDEGAVSWRLFRQLSYGRWCFLRDALGDNTTRCSLAQVVLQSAESTASYVRLAVAYAQLPQSEAEMWVDDASAFLRTEEALEDDVGQSVRDAAVSCLSQSMHVLPIGFARATAGQLLACLHEAGTDAGAEPWRMREAVWLAWQRIVDGCAGAATMVADVLPTRTLLDEVLMTDLHGPTLLTIRALAFVSTLLRHTRHCRPALPDIASTVDALMPVALASLQIPPSPQHPDGGVPTTSPRANLYLICAATCKLLRLLRPWCDGPRLERFFPALQETLYTTLLPDPRVEDDLLYLVLDTLTAWTRQARYAAASGGDAAAYEALPSSATLLLRAWRVRVQDPNVGEAVALLFREIVPCARCEEGVRGELPWLLSVVTRACSLPTLCTAPTVLRLLADVFRHGSAALAEATLAMTLSAVCSLLLATTESAVMVAAASCLAAALRRCRDASAVPVCVLPSLLQQACENATGSHGHDEPGANASLQSAMVTPQATKEAAVYRPFTVVLVAVARRMLHAEQPEARLMDVGDSLEAMMDSASQFTDDEVRQLLHVTLTRLVVATTASVREQLFMPLAVLLRRYREPFLLVLLQGGWLSAVFQFWLHDLVQFAQVRNVCKTCEALADLLTCWPADLLGEVRLVIETCPAGHTATRRSKRASRETHAVAKETMLLEHAIAIALARAARRLVNCATADDESESPNSSASQCTSDAEDEEDGYETLSDESDADAESTHNAARPTSTAATHQARPVYICATLHCLSPVLARYHAVLATKLFIAELHDLAGQMTCV